jgi:hypothetical protein
MNATTLTEPAPSISLTQVEQAIARCLNAHPIIEYTLPRESNPLTELLALMIYHRLDVVDAAQLEEKTLRALTQWSVAQ